jgi:hypothetical protein
MFDLLYGGTILPIEIHSISYKDNYHAQHKCLMPLRGTFRIASLALAVLGVVVIVKGSSVLLSGWFVTGCWAVSMGLCVLLFSAGNWMQFTRAFQIKRFAWGIRLQNLAIGGFCLGIATWPLL